MCWRKDWKNGLDIESKPEAINSNSNPPKILVLKRLLDFSPLSYASRTSVSKSKIHLYYKHFSVEELKTSQFVLNQGEKHRNTFLYSEHFQRRVRANWLVFNRIWVAVYCLRLGFDVQAIFPIPPSVQKHCHLPLHKGGRNRLCFYNMCGSAHFIDSLISR